MGTRDRMIDAAAQVMETKGLAATTTKEIAREAGYSEAALYKHFRDKEELFLAVLEHRLPPVNPLVTELTEHAGEADIEANLAAVAETALTFYGHSFPIAASIFATPTLLAAHRAAMERLGAGPHRPLEALTAYLRAEQRAGGVGDHVDVHAVASMLLGACLQHAFLTNFAGRTPSDREVRKHARALGRTLTPALLPADNR